MRISIFLLFGFLCFSSCSGQARNSETGADKNSTPHATNVVTENRNINGHDKKKNQISNRRKLGNFRVDGYIDKLLMSRSFFRNGLLIKEIAYNTQTKKQESEVTYFYKKDDKFDYAEVKSADGSKEKGPEVDKYQLDFLVQYEFLESKSIEFPLPDIVPSEVRDISTIFSIADNYSDYAKDIQADGNLKVIKFIGFNKGIGYERVVMTFRSGALPILVKDYELTLENSFPTKETIKTDEGELTKTYSYKDGKLIGVVYQFTDLEHRTNSLEKRFEYHELKQKP